MPRSVPTLRAAALLLAAGFFAGAFLMASLVWKYGNFVRPDPSTVSEVTNRADVPSAIERWDPGALASGDRPVGTSSSPEAAGEQPRTSASPPEKEPEEDGLDDLRRRRLTLPIDGVTVESLESGFDEPRGTRRHEALDIRAPRHTPVRAVEDGQIARLFHSDAGGLTIYQFDPTERYCYYYAHLERYADGLREGAAVERGQIIGYVGTSGNAPKQTPHLHFAIFLLTDEKQWWVGTPLDPYEVLRQ